MKTLIISVSDWANLAYNFSKALNSAGGNECLSCCLRPHPFGYKEQSLSTSIAHIRELIPKYDVILYGHGDISLLNQTQDLLIGKKVAVCYTGSAYRAASAAHNAAFNKIVSVSLTDHTEFGALGAKNLNYIATPIDVNNIDKFGHQLKKPYKIGHFPSNPEVKGTAEIVEMLGLIDLNFDFLHSIDKVSHEKQWKRMNDCDIYVELFKNKQGENEYGCWGVTAFEAAAAGKVVITQNLHLDVYKAVYGDCPIVICNDRKSFIENIKTLLRMGEPDISLLQTETFEWVREKHSFEATGNRLKKLLYE